MSARAPLAAAALPVVMALLFGAAGCGSDFRPVALEPTGRPAAPLGQVLDLEVQLPALQVAGVAGRGVTLDLVLEVEGSGFGRLPARVVEGRARGATFAAAVEILSDGRTTVFSGPDRWSTGRIGPLRVQGTVFEIALDGEPAGGGWTLAGRSWESQTGLFGPFSGWRRQRFLVTTTDFFAGGRVAEVSWARGREILVRRDLERTSADPALRRTGDAVFVLNRFSFDNLQRLDPDAGFRTAWQRTTGAGSNPHDVALLGAGRAYVTRYEPPYDDVAVIDPRNGVIVSSIPLGDLAGNPDGTPRADRMALAEGMVFVGLQDIDRTFTRRAEGKLAVIDPALDEVVGVIPLGGVNPGALEVLPGEDGRERLWVALGGVFPGLGPQELSGGVVVVNAFARVVERLALDDDDAGGNVGALAMVSPELGYAVVSDADFVNRVVAFDGARGEVLRAVLETREFVPEIEVGGARILAVPDRSFARPRLCLHRVPEDPAERETALGCADLPLPPYAIEALD